MPIQPNWSAPSQIQGSADNYVPLTGTTEIFSNNVDMGNHDVAHVIVDVDFQGSSDHVDVAVYGSLDGVAFDNVPRWPVRVSNDQDSQISIKVDGLVNFRIGFKQTGNTNTHQVRAYASKRNWVNA